MKGTVADGGTEVGLTAATIRVAGGPSVTSEIDGTYLLSLAPGTYTIVFSTPEYVEQRRTVTVTASQVVALDVVLAPVPKIGTAETIEVQGAIDTRKDSAVLAERRASATISDAVSAQQISRSPDSNASDAAKRMVAATIQDNRYIVIRGLGGRYSTTLLNGVPLPSPDPDVPAAPLDLFPASLITNLTVNKTFSPDLPGNFAGGALGIETRSYPTSFQLKAKLGIAANHNSSFRTLNFQSGGSLDMLGYDDGSRSLPSAIPSNKIAGDSSFSQDQVTAQTAAFASNWQIRRSTVGPNLSFGASLGDSFKLSDQRLGYFGSVSFSHGYARRASHIQGVGEDSPSGGSRLPSPLQLDDEQGIEQANLGAVGGVGWNPASGHKLDLFTLYSHTADITTSDVRGTDASTAEVARTRMQFLQRELLFTQLVGDDRLSDAVTLEWQGNVAHVTQHEPDTRDLARSPGTDGGMVIVTTPGSSERLFSELSDNTFGGSLAARAQLSEAVRVKAGGSIQHSTRDYQARRFHFTLTGSAPFQEPDQAFDPRKAGTEMVMYEPTLPSDGYAADRTIAGGYAMADINLTPKLRLVGGARFERSSLDIRLESEIDLMAPPMHTTHGSNDILPSLNAVYALTPNMNLRAAYNITVARANFREVAPSLYFDYIRRRVIGGNPDLEETHIQNADIRWEMFLGDSEVLAASVFAKYFTRPIERTVVAGGSGDNVGFANSSAANSYGIELEARLSLGRIAPALAAFSLGGNLSLIGSQIEIDGGGTRPLQGQSPYVANLGLGYEHRAFGTRVDLAYNVFGRRIDEVGIGGTGGIYEEPFHRLDLTVSQPLHRHLRLKLAGGNLLDQRVVRTQSDVEIHAYKVGVTILGSVEYSLE